MTNVKFNVCIYIIIIIVIMIYNYSVIMIYCDYKFSLPDFDFLISV